MVCLLRSDLPIAIYPCATATGGLLIWAGITPTGYSRIFQFIRNMAPLLKSYLAYAFERSTRSDFLVALEEEPPAEVMDRICQRPHHVWETALWTQVAQRRLVKTRRGTFPPCTGGRSQIH